VESCKTIIAVTLCSHQWSPTWSRNRLMMSSSQYWSGRFKTSS
jgi:hypothetical protein